MRVALDTNILLHLADVSAEDHVNVKAAILALEKRRDVLCIVPQNLIEFWAVATRSRIHNGLSFSSIQTAERMRLIEETYRLLPDNARIFPAWQNLVLKHNVRGKQVHDTRLAAAYQVHRVSHLLTENETDFRRFPFLTCFTSKDVLNGLI